jgi:hypothetical protein
MSNHGSSLTQTYTKAVRRSRYSPMLVFRRGRKTLCPVSKGATIDERTFRISDGERVRWEWFYYGRRKGASNLYFEEFVKTDRGITVTTNIDWHKPKFKPKRSEPAVEIV